ncbi:Uncharacterised protein [Shigella sonnei]|nr:Uncharacterised protein [Shigella sonnei]
MFSFGVSERIFWFFVIFSFPKIISNFCRPFDGFFIFNPFLNQDSCRLTRNTPTANTNMARQCLFKKCRSAPRTFQTLRGNAQTRCSTQHHSFWRTGVITVKVGSRVSG